MKRTLVITLCLLLLSIPCLCEVRYQVTQLNFHAYDINDKGQVVGDLGIDGSSHSVVWDAEHGIRDLNVDAERSRAVAINNNGQIIISAYANQRYKGLLWDNGEIRSAVPEWWGDAFLTGINDHGQIIDSGGAIVWSNGQTELLRSLGGDRYAHAINNLGQVVGKSRTVNGPYHAVLWDHGNVKDLGSLESSSEATAINDLGQIVGISERRIPTYAQSIVLWENGQMRDLGGLPGANASYAYDINNKGQIVGRSSQANGPQKAFIWENGVMTDLNTLVSPDLNLGLECHYAINNIGQIIVLGKGFYLLTPVPEPSGFLTILCGLGAFIGGCKWRKAN